MASKLTPFVLLSTVLVACASDPPPPAQPAPAPPPPPVEEEPTIKPGLTPTQMRQAMSQVEPAIRGCYTVAYSGKEGGTGSLTVDFTVNPDGSVKTASIVDSSFGNPTFENCIRKVYEGMSFPKAPGSTAASRPYNFRDASGDVQAEPASAAQ